MEATCEVLTGTLSFVGSNVYTASSTILGFEAYIEKPESTVDQYYLSDELDTANAAQLYFPYLTSVISNGLVQPTITPPFPIALYHTTLSSPSSITHTFMDDFYYKIHLSVYTLNLGNILSEVYQQVYIWNANLTNTNLNSIDETTLDNVVISHGFTLPYTFRPIEETPVDITIFPTGSASINGAYTFNFSGSTVRLNIEGQRLVVWPFLPDVTFVEGREWLTDVIPSKEGEQRYTLREYPRASLRYSYIFKNSNTYSKARALAHNTAHLGVAIPVWSESVRVTNLTTGDTVISIDTTLMELQVGGSILIWASEDLNEVKEVESFTSISITTTLPLANTYTKAFINVLLLGSIQGGINFVRDQNHSKKCDITFKADRVYTQGVWPTAETYKSLPILLNKQVVSKAIMDKFDREMQVFDSDIGSYVRFDIENYTRNRREISLKSQGIEENYSIRRLFDSMMGKYTAFWLPTFHDDLIPITSILGSLTNAITVKYAAWSLNRFKYIRIVGNTILNTEVSGAINNMDGTETISFIETSSTTITDIKYIQVLTKVRLDTDTIEYYHDKAGIVTVKAIVTEIL